MGDKIDQFAADLGLRPARGSIRDAHAEKRLQNRGTRPACRGANVPPRDEACNPISPAAAGLISPGCRHPKTVWPCLPEIRSQYAGRGMSPAAA